MRKTIKSYMKFLLITAYFGAFLLVPLNANASPVNYIRLDLCSQYIPKCNIAVIKCAYTGTEGCYVEEQIPCEEACEEDQQ